MSDSRSQIQTPRPDRAASATDAGAPPPSFELPPDNRPRWFFFSTFILLAAAAAWALWSHFNTRQKIVIAAIPPPPASLSSFPEVLRTRLADAEKRARSGHGRDATGALAELARLYHANGFSGQASRIYPALIRLDPREPRWPFLQASLLAGFGRLDEALPFLLAARELAPERVPLRLQLADTLLKLNRRPDAALVYRSVIADAPGNIHAIIGLARIDVAAQSWQNALAQLQLAADIRPDCADTWNLLATVYEKTARPARAADVQNALARAKKSPALPPPPDDWTGSLADDCFDAYQVRVAADIARAAGDADRARGLLTHALSFAPGDAATHRQLGKLLWDLGPAHYPAAREQLLQATTLAPADADAWAWLIGLSNASGDTADALTDSALALANCPQSGGVRYEYARALKAAGNLDAALYQYKETQRLRPEEAVSLGIEIALIHFRQNRVGEGAAALRAVLDADAGQPVALTTLARLAIGKNDSADAARWLARAIAEPRVPRADIGQLQTLWRRQFPGAPFPGAPSSSSALPFSN